MKLDSKYKDAGANWSFFFCSGGERLQECLELRAATRKKLDKLVETLLTDDVDRGIAASMRCILLREWANEDDLNESKGLPEDKQCYAKLVADELEKDRRHSDSRGTKLRVRSGLGKLKIAYRKKFGKK